METVTSWPPLAAQCSCSTVIGTHHIQPKAWIVWLVWWHCTHGSSVSPSYRTFHFSSREKSSVKSGVLSMLTVGPRSATDGISIATSCRETRSPSLKGDDHKILVVLTLRFYGVMVPIRKTTVVCRTLRIVH